MNEGKIQSALDGFELMREFCSANRVPPPDVEAVEKDRWRFGVCGYYRPATIFICPDRCAAIGRAGRAWSYPGYVIDRTPYGVVQHELGHHVDHQLSTAKGAYGGDFSASLRERTGEPRLTGYCPNDWEWFAEMFRLFVTNSDLLRCARPRAHAELCGYFTPVVDRPWREVLRDAPPRTVELAVRRWGHG